MLLQLINYYIKLVCCQTENINLLYHDTKDPNNNDFDSVVGNRYIIKPGNHFKYFKNERGLWIGNRVLPNDIDYFENYLDESIRRAIRKVLH